MNKEQKLHRLMELQEAAEKIGCVVIPAAEYETMRLKISNAVCGAWSRQQRAKGLPVGPVAAPGQTSPAAPTPAGQASN